MKNKISHKSIINPTNFDVNDCNDLWEKSKGTLKSFEQNVFWNINLNNDKLEVIKFYRGDENIGYCVVKNKLFLKEILFGPILADENDLIDIINHFPKLYKFTKCIGLEIQLPYSSSFTAATKLDSNKYIKEINHFWCTQLLDIEKPLNIIINNFSKNHKRSIKKSDSSVVNLRRIKTEKDILSFVTLYKTMYKRKGIKSEFNNPSKTISKMIKLITKNNIGLCLGVFTNEKLIGGVIMLYQGDSVFYRIGCTDEKFKKTPILHLSFLETIKIAKSNNLKYFDLGGFAVNPDTQLSGINRFKTGFGGMTINYPKKIIIQYKPMLYKFLSFLIKTKRKANL